MRIAKTRIHKVSRYFRNVPEDTEFVLAVPVDEIEVDLLNRTGFESSAVRGDQVLPAADFGPTSCFNANGKEVPNRSFPKEKITHAAEWTRHEWNGPDTREVTDIVHRTYKRYPRDIIAAPAVELRIDTMADGNMVIVSPNMAYTTANTDRILHTVNLFLEIFGFCDLLTGDLSPLLPAPIRRLNWQLLPPGEYPWNQVKLTIEDRVLAKLSHNQRVVAESRLETITRYKPEFVAVGLGGFTGYMVFGFPKKNIFVLECLDWGNATYVLNDDWESVSQLSKAQVIAAEHHRERIVHDRAWKRKIEELFGNTLR